MGDEGSRAVPLLAVADGAQRAATRQLHVEAELLQFTRDVADDAVGVAGGAGEVEQLFEFFE